MKVFVVCFYFIGLLFISGCGIMGTEESISPIIDTDLPAEANTGELVSFNIHHIAYNGCGKYSKHETVEEGKIITITFYAKYPKGKICSDDEPTLETVYHFQPKEKGDYYFKFYNNNQRGQEYLLDTINVK